jgi:signal transduction histidine kinase
MIVVVESFDVRAMVENVIDSAQPLVRKNGNCLDLNCPAEPVFMISDQTKVHQCLLNLVSNAAKFTRAGRVRLDVRRDGARIIFSVADTGPGMTQQQMERLFEPFTQVHTEEGIAGTGLGLAITRRLCRLLEGDVRVESEPGRGSVFSLSFPLTIRQLETESLASV